MHDLTASIEYQMSLLLFAALAGYLLASRIMKQRAYWRTRDEASTTSQAEWITRFGLYPPILPRTVAQGHRKG